jgi:methylase of polypeptide subunit release factors
VPSDAPPDRPNPHPGTDPPQADPPRSDPHDPAPHNADQRNTDQRDAYPRDAYRRDAQPHDAQRREADGYDAPSHAADRHAGRPHDAHPHAAHPHDAEPHAGHPRDGDPRAAHPHEAHPHEAHPHAAHPHAAHPHDTHPHDTHPHDTHPHDTHPHDTDPPDARPHDAADPHAAQPPDADPHAGQSHDAHPRAGQSHDAHRHDPADPHDQAAPHDQADPHDAEPQHAVPQLPSPQPDPQRDGPGQPGPDRGGPQRDTRDTPRQPRPHDVGSRAVGPLLSDSDADRLADALRAAGYTAEAVVDLLGEEAAGALARAERVPGLRATTGGSPLETLVRLFLLGSTEPAAAVGAALPLDAAPALAAVLLEPDRDGYRAAIDLRPYERWWVVADLGTDVRPGPVRPDHVLGVGPASLTLSSATVRRPVSTALDVGTGCGVQSLHLSQHAGAVTGTDVLPRALAMARLTGRLNGLHWELIEGDLLSAVEGRQFDLVVSNPPFIVGPGDGGFAYRDSGLAGDGVSRQLIRRAPGVLTDGGRCQLLANWMHRRGEDWQDRLAGWLDGLGCDAWVWQREVADPAQYVALWLTDAGEKGSPAYEARYSRWLDWFAATGVKAVGFGLVTLRKSGAERPTVRIEDVPQPIDEPAGPAVAEWFDRLDALRGVDIAAVRFDRAPGLQLEQTASPGPDGWEVTSQRLRQPAGLRWTAPVDPAVAALVAGCDGTRPLREIALVLELAYGIESDDVREMARALAERGFLVPTASIQ